MSWTGNRGSTRLMMLAMIICRCEWSEINHLGAKLEWQDMRNGSDQTGNVHELYTTFTNMKQQHEARVNIAALHFAQCFPGCSLIFMHLGLSLSLWNKTDNMSWDLSEIMSSILQISSSMLGVFNPIKFILFIYGNNSQQQLIPTAKTVS